MKKSAIGLSVSAIVILILAIVMLGLGLGFISDKFNKVSKQIEQQISAEHEPPMASAGNPIALSREVISTNSNSREVLKVSAFNPTNESWSSANPTISCIDATIEQVVNPRDIKQGASSTFNILLTIPSLSANDYLCKIIMGGYEKDLTIKITK